MRQPDPVFELLRPQYSMYESLYFWVIAAGVLGTVLPYLLLVWGLRGLRGGGSEYRPGPMGPLGPLFGQPTHVRKDPEEIEADRQHAYRRWGSLCSVGCIVGGFALLALGCGAQGQDSSIEIANVVTFKNAAPGVVLIVIGFLVWKQTHK